MNYTDYVREHATGDAKVYIEILEEEIGALRKIIGAYGEDEGYIPKRVSDLYNEYFEE